MPHLEATQSTTFTKPTYFWVQYTDGCEMAAVCDLSDDEYEQAKSGEKLRQGKTVASGFFSGTERRQTSGTGQSRYKSLKHFLRDGRRKISEVRRHNWVVIG